jgi:mannosyltransferase OCH1-like enzyme
VSDRLKYTVQFAQFLLLAKPNHPTIRELINQVNVNVQSLLDEKDPMDGFSEDEIYEMSGPFIFTNVLMEYMAKAEGRTYSTTEFMNLEKPRLVGDVLVLPHDSFGWLRSAPSHDENDPIILAEHLFIGSWKGD